MKIKLLDDIQRYIANVSIGASTVRGNPKGTAAAARKHLLEIKLSRIPVKDEKRFKAWLNKETLSLKSALPKEAKHWGSARKYLNIFLRNVVYNRFLYDAYNLSGIESWLEVPLDKHIASSLYNESNKKELPRWKTIKGLSQSNSKKFQDFAAKIAVKKGINRADLDVIFWRRNSDNK